MKEQSNGGEVEKLRRQRRVLAEFGGHALRTDDLDALLQEAVELVSEAMHIDLVKVLELQPDGETMLVRAGVNWNPGVVGHAKFGAHRSSPGGYALQSNEPVVSPDLSTEDRFEIPSLLLEHDVKSMVNVLIPCEKGARGVLEVDSRKHRNFDGDDVSFLQNYANFIGSAIDRIATHQELQYSAERQKILVGELHHRVKNMLANVSSIVKRTLSSSDTLEEFSQSFDLHFAALLRSQELLAEAFAGRLQIRDAIRMELEAHAASEGQRFTLRGPMILLPPTETQGLAIVLHELTTNAVKYGALSTEAGSIDIAWERQPGGDSGGDTVALAWRERGVDLREEPQHSGFGMRVIRRGVAHMLRGSSEVAFHRDGLECVIRFPMPMRNLGGRART